MLLMLLLSLLVPMHWFACSGHCIHSLICQISPLFSRLRIVLLALAIRLRLHVQPRRYGKASATNITGKMEVIYRTRAKPEWVKQEVLRLKALMPHSGCRKIADAFNRRFEEARHMTAGKTYVSNTIRQYYYAIQVLRKHLKNAKPKSVPKNLVWALDLTGKTTLDGQTRMILAIIEHASRAALTLEALQSKSSWTLVSKLVAVIKRYGKPKMIRADNEAIFTSRVFVFALFLLGIRHQKTALHCPWQNGRVERFFGTLKTSLNQLTVTSFDALNIALGEFHFFYNHVRSHQNLAGATPADTWASDKPHVTPVKQEYWFEAWDGLLAGYYLRR